MGKINTMEFVQKRGEKILFNYSFPKNFLLRREMVEHKILSLLTSPLPLFFGMLSFRPLVEPRHQPTYDDGGLSFLEAGVFCMNELDQNAPLDHMGREIIEPLAEKSGTTHSYMILFCKYQPRNTKLFCNYSHSEIYSKREGFL